MNANQIMIEIDKLLQKWELYSTENRVCIEKNPLPELRHDIEHRGVTTII